MCQSLYTFPAFLSAIITYDRSLNLSEVLVYSSNIGSAKVAEDIGPVLQRSYMEKLGLLARPSLELPEPRSRFIRKNGDGFPPLPFPMAMGCLYRLFMRPEPSLLRPAMANLSPRP